MTVKQLDHINLTVADLEASISWYQRVFAFEVVERDIQDGLPWAILRSGDAMLCIYQRPAAEHLDRFELAKRKQHGVSHFALRVEDAKAWQATMDREELTPRYDGAITWKHSTSWYLNDPTGYEIEVVSWHGDQIAFG